jgi:hypothetical protein
VVCADPEQLADADLEAVAAAVEAAQVAAIAAALGRVRARVPPGTPVVAVGVGAFLARAAAERCGLAVAPLGPGDPSAHRPPHPPAQRPPDPPAQRPPDPPAPRLPHPPAHPLDGPAGEAAAAVALSVLARG